MTTSTNRRMTLNLSTREDLIAVQSSLQQPSSPSPHSVGLLISDPRLLQNSAAELNSFVANNVGRLSKLQDVRLAVRGPGKSAEEDANCVTANVIADLLTSLFSLQLPLSLELSVSKLEGSLHRLCSVLAGNRHLYRVVLHGCDNEDDDRHQGMLPVLQALSQCSSLQTLNLEAVQLPVGDITAHGLAKLSHLERLEFKHCINLGNEELLPLVESLGTNLQHFKLSTGLGLQQAHTGRQWGQPVVAALAAKLQDPSCALASLSLTTTDPQVSFKVIVHDMESNTSLQRLHLYNGKPKAQLGQELLQILSSNQNMTLQHCNSLGLSFADAAPLHFYTRLNQLNRSQLLATFASNDSSANPWMSLLLEHSQDHRIVHYLLTQNPTLVPTNLY